MIVWEGPSRIHGRGRGRRVAVVVTGIQRPSENRKTGAMLQAWILPVDRRARRAHRGIGSATVCGDCPLAARACYVGSWTIGAVRRAYWAGAYSHGTATDLPPGVPIRIGAWGDPAAVPIGVWQALVSGRRWTGYTHQWRRLRGAGWRRLLMASVESTDGAARAQRAGWRTFRVAPRGAMAPAPGEIVCPATTATAARCATCLLCDGQRRGGGAVRSIVVEAHGSGAGAIV